MGPAAVPGTAAARGTRCGAQPPASPGAAGKSGRAGERCCQPSLSYRDASGGKVAFGKRGGKKKINIERGEERRAVATAPGGLEDAQALGSGMSSSSAKSCALNNSCGANRGGMNLRLRKEVVVNYTHFPNCWIKS